MNGQIQNIDPRWLQAYFDSNPAVSPRTRAAIRNAIDKQEKSRIAQLERQLQETQQKTLQIMAYCQQLEGINGVKSDYIKNLTAEFTGKINASNDIIQGLVKDLDRVKASNQAAITEGEKKSHNATGSNGEVPQALYNPLR
jgi:(p)ppGpp synthase/HD superfamily hydrolase